MKTLFTIRHGLIGVLVAFALGPCMADPIEQPYKGLDKINVLKTNKAGLRVYDVAPKGYLANNNDFMPDDYYINKGAYKVTAEDIGKQVPIFMPEDVKKFGLHCEYLCADAENNVVGRAFNPKLDGKRLQTGKK